MNLFYPLKKWLTQINLTKKRKSFQDDFSDFDQKELTDEDSSVQSSYFFGIYDAKKEESIVMRLGNRNHSLNEVFFFYQGNHQFLVTTKDYYSEEETPLKVKCLQGAQRWAVSFEDDLIDKLDHDKVHHVLFKGEFIATMPFFDFQFTNENPMMASCIARCKWDKEFIYSNHSNNQRHMEQNGHFVGQIIIDDQSFPIDSPAARDRSYGKRIWNEMYDHIWLYACSEDGEIFNFSKVTYPILKDMRNGYCSIDKDIWVCMKKADFTYCYDGIGPDHMAVDMTLIDGRHLDVQVDRKYYYQTNYENGNFYFKEGLGVIMVNGKKFYGSIEFGFNKDKKKWNH